MILRGDPTKLANEMHCIERSSDYIFCGGEGVGSRILDMYNTRDQ